MPSPSPATTARIPALPGIDSSLGFLKDGYEFGLQRFVGERRNAFRTRIAGKKVVVMRGNDAARIFYDGDRFSRERAMPNSLQHLLQDKGSVQALEGEAHHHRKSMFARLLMDDAALARVRELYAEEWQRATANRSGFFHLHDESVVILTRVAVRWLGLDPDDVDITARSQELIGMIENAAAVGPPNWWARIRRRRTETWAATLVHQVREGDLKVDPESPIAQIAEHREHDGSQMDFEEAAVEVINVLRPTVAVARYIVFAAYALHRRPEWTEKFQEGNPADVWNFVQEVRRYYPFFPVVAGRVQRPFGWHGHRFEKGDWVMLDLFATNHDERLWPDHKQFRPERFRDWSGDPNSLIPQGAGEVETGHRCPGERATIALMEEAVVQLTQHTDYTVPPQDLRVSMRKFPALPRSGFELSLARSQ